MNLFYQPLIPDGVHHLDADESKHSTRVLRKKNGDSILITDGKGFFYNAVITDANPQQCRFEITQTTAAVPKNFYIHIAISPTKNPDRIEWFVEKAVEIGVDAITFLDCEHTERSHLKFERLQKLSVSAMKQSVQATLPVLTPLTPLKKVIENAGDTARFIAHVDSSNTLHLQQAAKPSARYLVLIGPEGDFSAEELGWARDHQFTKVSLGATRLRTETAGLAACHILNLINYA